MIGSCITNVLARLWKDVAFTSFGVVPEYNFIMQNISEEMRYIFLFIMVYLLILLLLHNVEWWDGWWMMNCKGFGGSCHGIIEVLLQCLFGGTEESHEYQYRWCNGHSLNQALCEYKPGILHDVILQTLWQGDRSFCMCTTLFYFWGVGETACLWNCGCWRAHCSPPRWRMNEYGGLIEL